MQVGLAGFETGRPAAVDLSGVEVAALDISMEPRMSETGRRGGAADGGGTLQAAPMTGAVVEGEQLNDAGAFNVNRLRELVPTVQFFSTNPRNSSVSIRGLGLPFGLTNDGIDPAVGFYVDGVFYARSAAATLDLVDVERLEVLRGPQGRRLRPQHDRRRDQRRLEAPGFTPRSRGRGQPRVLGFIQVKSSLEPADQQDRSRRGSRSRARAATALLYNTTSRSSLNEMNNLGGRGQLLFAASDKFAMVLAADHTRQRPQGFAQVVAGVAPTLRPANRQYPQMAADLGYTPPSFNAFDRLTDADTPHQSNQDLGGTSLTFERRVRTGQAHLDHRVALLELGSLQRSRLPRAARSPPSRPTRPSSGSSRRRSATRRPSRVA